MHYLVTGAGGFVGRALCKVLREAGHEVTGVARGRYPDVEKLGVTLHRADLSDSTYNLDQLFTKKIDGVFHTAAKVAMWGNWDESYRSNVVGTQRLVEVCKKHSVAYFVYTSSPSVIADGSDLRGIDETKPYPAKHLTPYTPAPYPASKAQAERFVLASSDASFQSIALRPHLIFGPGDTSLTKKVVEAAFDGRLKIIGNGKNIVDFTYIDDCVSAHVAAMRALVAGKQLGGRAYFISSGDPYPFWEWVEQVVRKNGYAKPLRRIPASVAYALGWVCEQIWTLGKLSGEPRMTRFLAEELATDHWFSIDAAKQDFAWEPQVRVSEGIGKL